MPSVSELVGTLDARRARVRVIHGIAVLVHEVPAAPPTADAKKKFRGSMAWRRTRYAVLAENAKKNGGKACCVICGAQALPETPLHVDHILPISTPDGWKRRLDKKNLRVACADCNTGRLATPIEAEGLQAPD